MYKGYVHEISYITMNAFKKKKKLLDTGMLSFCSCFNYVTHYINGTFFLLFVL